jgi:predicted 2-oxoglutarate/Fe(II)-dependent dioxygenase YbiX
VFLYRYPDFLTPTECSVIRQAMDSGAVEAAEVLKSGIQREQRVRNASLIEPPAQVIQLVEDRLEVCRGPMGSALHMALGPREGAGFIRYPDGGFYRVHRDRGSDPHWPDAGRRAASLVIFLNASDRSRGGEFDGGILRLYFPGEDIDVTPQAGLLVGFPSGIPHEVTVVSSGARDTIVDWFYGPD